MAAVKVRSFENMDFAFDHCPEGHEVLSLIKEGLKHLLFIRRQLPLPFMLLEREQCLETARGGLGHKIRGIKRRKRDAAISAVKEATNALEDFANGAKIHAIAMLFGSTIVSPKEVFILRPDFKGVNLEHNSEREEKTHHSSDLSKSLTIGSSRLGRNFVRSLVTDPTLSSLGDIRPTNVFIFVLASRNTDCFSTCKFLPQQHYQLPYKGKYYEIILTDKGVGKPDTPARKHPIDQLLDIQNNLDLIWYQTNIRFQGFSDSKNTMF